MQALPTQGLRINRRHPDARGCYFAMPVMERGGEVVRDLSMNAAMGHPVWTGTRNYANIRSGRAIQADSGTKYVATPVAGTPYSKEFSMMCRVQFIDTVTSYFIIGCGYLMFHTPVSWIINNDANTASITSGQAAPVTGVEYVLGIRWHSSTNKATFFINGIKDEPATTLDLSGVSRSITVGSPSVAQPMNGYIRDIRMWNRYLPDVAFERYYTNPNAFYIIGRPWTLKGAISGAGRYFFPFLHPALQS